MLTSGRLAAAVDGLADFEPLGEQTLRGMGRPVPIINLIGLRSVIERRRGTPSVA